MSYFKYRLLPSHDLDENISYLTLVLDLLKLNKKIDIENYTTIINNFLTWDFLDTKLYKIYWEYFHFQIRNYDIDSIEKVDKLYLETIGKSKKFNGLLFQLLEYAITNFPDKKKLKSIILEFKDSALENKLLNPEFIRNLNPIISEETDKKIRRLYQDFNVTIVDYIRSL